MRYLDKVGRITDKEFDHAGSVTGDSEYNIMYTVELVVGKVTDVHFR